jgi:hypothetical protein
MVRTSVSLVKLWKTFKNLLEELQEQITDIGLPSGIIPKSSVICISFSIFQSKQVLVKDFDDRLNWKVE